MVHQQAGLFNLVRNFLFAGKPFLSEAFWVVLEAQVAHLGHELGRDAVITQLNTWSDASTHILTVVLRINKEEISDVVASFQRHEFTVRYYMGEELFRNELQSNLDHLMNYLNI